MQAKDIFHLPGDAMRAVSMRERLSSQFWVAEHRIVAGLSNPFGQGAVEKAIASLLNRVKAVAARQKSEHRVPLSEDREFLRRYVRHGDLMQARLLTGDLLEAIEWIRRAGQSLFQPARIEAPSPSNKGKATR